MIFAVFVLLLTAFRHFRVYKLQFCTFIAYKVTVISLITQKRITQAVQNR